MYKLTEEEKLEMIEETGLEGKSISLIERRLEFYQDKIFDKSDYYELVIDVTSQYEVIKEKINGCKSKIEYDSVYMTIDEIIKLELHRKYPDDESLKVKKLKY